MNNIVLGIHVGHDRGACIIKNGEVIAALANERIDRIKHSQSIEIPFDVINVLLKYCSLTIDDINAVGLSGVAVEGMSMYNWYREEFHSHYKTKYIPFYFVHHHDAHAYSSYYSCNFNECLIFVFDGGGDFFDSKQESESIYIGKNGVLTKIDRRLQNMAGTHERRN